MTTASRLDRLTRREHQELALMDEGRPNGALGDELKVELRTVET
jgi:hypothetical protein